MIDMYTLQKMREIWCSPITRGETLSRFCWSDSSSRSNTGATILQGPHPGAQQSTRTGPVC